MLLQLFVGAIFCCCLSSGQFRFDRFPPPGRDDGRDRNRFGGPGGDRFGGPGGDYYYDDATTAGPEPTASNLSCYSCSLDFRYAGYDNRNPCLGRHGEPVNPDLLVMCGILDKFCKVERTEVNGVLTVLVRQCTDTCYYGCRPKGFGIYTETCAECCDTEACNDHYPGIDSRD